jgi:GTPase SAR1 family protein
MVIESAIGVKLGIEVLKRTAPSGLARVRTWLTGHEVLVVGPPRAGKTSFVEYLQYGILEPEQETVKTIETEKSATFSVKVGRDSSLELRVRRTVDVPGQVGPVEHALIAKKRQPSAIVVILNLATPIAGTESAGEWLLQFCQNLDMHLAEDRAMKKRLKTLMVVANKSDKVPSQTITKRLEHFRRQLKRSFNHAFTSKTGSLPILPCVLVETSDGSKQVDAVIVRLAKALSK